MDTIHHIALPVKNLKETLAWYTHHFDVKVTYEDDTWALIAFDNISIALVVPEQHPPHIAITCPDAEKYGPLKKHRDNTESIYMNDPSGNVVEMLKLPDTIK